VNETENQISDQAPNQTPQTLEPTVDQQERTWAMFCHLAGLAGYIMPFGGSIIGPLIFWLIKKEEYPLVDDQGKEAVNFQITMTILAVICVVLSLKLTGCFLVVALILLNLIMITIASLKANTGQKYRYPFAIRLIK
jgi:uncharacterized Tic20 family protein